MSADFDTPSASAGLRTPPQDLTAEEGVLGGMMLSKDAIADVIESLRADDFYKPAHETIYEAMVDIYTRGEPVDSVTVAHDLSKRGDLARAGGAPYLHTLIATVPTAANAGFYARIVREKAILRRLVEAGTKIVQIGYDASGDTDAVVNQAQSEIYQVTERGSSQDYVRLGDVVQDTVNEIERAGDSAEGPAGVPTGFDEFDELTLGLHPGQMIVVAARPGVGKSTFALDIVRSASIRHRLSSVVFSLEMSRTELSMRLLSAESDIPLSMLRKGDLQEHQWGKLSSTMADLDGAPLFIDDSPNMALAEIRAKCRRLKQQHDLQLIVIDYLQLMSSGKKVESRQQEVSEFSRSLKLLAKELEVPLIALSQLNRASEQRTDRKPMISDLRESGSIEQDADMVVLLHRPEMYEPEGGDRPGEADVIVAKHRNGETRTIAVAFQGSKSRFANMGAGGM